MLGWDDGFRGLANRESGGTVKVAVVGSGNIGGGVARQLGAAGHEVAVSFSRDPASLRRLAVEIGPSASVATPSEAVAFGEVVVFSVPWAVIDEAIAACGSLDGKIVIDTTNQFGREGVVDLDGKTAAEVNQARMPGARYTKSFNTLTAGFQHEAAKRRGDNVVQWICGDDREAKAVVSGLITDAGFIPVDLGGTADAAVMEAPRRPGAVYGEEYRAEDAAAVLEALRQSRPIPPTPRYT
jgi:predicted dinucleotide-binding enzyme